jgi:hypothetical protein
MKARLRLKLRIENQSVGYRFQAETLLFWESGRHTVAVRSQDCSNSMAPMRGGRQEFRTGHAVEATSERSRRRAGAARIPERRRAWRALLLPRRCATAPRPPTCGRRRPIRARADRPLCQRRPTSGRDASRHEAAPFAAGTVEETKCDFSPSRRAGGKKLQRRSPDRWVDIATTDCGGPLRRQGNRSSLVPGRDGCRSRTSRGDFTAAQNG